MLQLEQLLSWLNSKGSREYALKADLKEWRPYLMGGAKRRLKDLEPPSEEPVATPPVASKGRKTRKSLPPKEEVDLSKPAYLRWQNIFAQAIVSHKK